MKGSLIKRRESIIVSTIVTLNQVGLQNLSTKLIAKREGVSEGTLFRHFKNKTEILLAVIDQFSQFDDAIIETCQVNKLSSLETIKYFFNAYAEYYENYPEITVIVQSYDSLMCDPELSDKVRSIIDKRADFIFKTVKEAQKNGVIQKNIEARLIEAILSGASRELCLKWRMSKFDFSINEKSREMVNAVLAAFSENSHSKDA
ncbi:TetR family transcriptional regulator [Acetobacterium fimetarium]|uniref:TetR family transcriptional regulator n=1 Tax=Acetobacterium fimetarium TaxID=52691 RepID=A0ABR6WRG5_9FIRM|nr:TetR/AcrR family transcriptional regulator [Acetobacterium fimetarium]MBC3803217.1 TetR family transcriptional regulator [Acetobacterium fimetarium]